jgi:hypothetical protein
MIAPGGPPSLPEELPRRASAAYNAGGMLLVLDNFEHVMDAAPLVAALL